MVFAYTYMHAWVCDRHFRLVFQCSKRSEISCLTGHVLLFFFFLIWKKFSAAKQGCSKPRRTLLFGNQTKIQIGRGLWVSVAPLSSYVHVDKWEKIPSSLIYPKDEIGKIAFHVMFLNLTRRYAWKLLKDK